MRGGVVVAILAALVVLALTWPHEPPESAERIEGRTSRVVDGDSLYLATHVPQIRLWGVDAPERDEAGFQEATATLERIAGGAALSCRPIDRDRYGRTVARCFRADGQEVNRMMIESGTATEFMRYSKGFYSGK